MSASALISSEVAIPSGCTYDDQIAPYADAGPKSAALSNSSLLEMAELPKHLAIAGGSYIGLDFDQNYRRFGAQVTVSRKARA